MRKSPTTTGHSADVRMHLQVNGHTLPVRELGGDFLVLAESIDHPPTEAELFLSIDGDERRRTLWLARGLKNGECEIDISRENNRRPAAG
jgi:hypothetical protein